MCKYSRKVSSSEKAVKRLIKRSISGNETHFGNSLASAIVSGRSQPVVSGSPIANKPPTIVSTPNIRGGRIDEYCDGTKLP